MLKKRFPYNRAEIIWVRNEKASFLPLLEKKAKTESWKLLNQNVSKHMLLWQLMRGQSC